jgi:SAM-dependent methyltransferase
VYQDKQYWAGLAKSYGWADAEGFAPVLHPGAPHWFNVSIDRMQEDAWRRALGFCKCADGSLVLDVGCGTGRWLRRYAQRGLRPVGMDRTPGMLRRVVVAGTHCPILCAGAQQIPFRDGTFDFVASVTVVQHIPPPTQEYALKELARMLRQGGYLLLFELIRGRGPHIFPHHPREWIEQVSSLGLSSVCWFGQEYVLLDRAFVSLVQRLRGTAARASESVLPGGEGEAPAGKRPHPFAQQLYWLARRVTFKLSEWTEPIARCLCPAEWATHGVFVFKKK